ncbi:MAG: hypothetical protein V3R64_07615 [Sphingomonadales bacterium]
MWSLLGALLLVLLVGYIGTHPEHITKRNKVLIVLMAVLVIAGMYLELINPTTKA